MSGVWAHGTRSPVSRTHSGAKIRYASLGPHRLKSACTAYAWRSRRRITSDPHDVIRARSGKLHYANQITNTQTHQGGNNSVCKLASLFIKSDANLHAGYSSMWVKRAGGAWLPGWRAWSTVSHTHSRVKIRYASPLSSCASPVRLLGDTPRQVCVAMRRTTRAPRQTTPRKPAHRHTQIIRRIVTRRAN